MVRGNLYPVALLILGLSAHTASAAVTVFSDNFNTINSSQSDAAPAGWTEVGGTVDSIKNGGFGIDCRNDKGGCVDLGGSAGQAGYLVSAATFNLIAGDTYRLSAQVSGNQRNTIADDLVFGFFNASNLVLKTKTISGINSSDAFTKYSVSFTPSSNVSAALFFDDLLGKNNNGPVLDNVRLVDITAVPLPAAAWLMLSGVVALGAVARRRRSGVARA